jgi:hypothetical protein
MSWFSDLFNSPTVERPSPKIRINQSQLHIYDDGVLTVEGLKGCYLAAIEPKNSMEPGIDDGMYVVLDPTIPYIDLIMGDIIYYEAPSYRAIHRIISIGNDNMGWYCETKGDNNSRKDGIKVRPEYIKGVWRATLN